jgi:hypothetical protein
MAKTKAFNLYSFLIILAVIAISAYIWGWLSFIYQPERTHEDRNERCSGLSFYLNDPIQKVGYPLPLAERKLDCTIAAELSTDGYGPYITKPLGLITDSVIWIGSTAIAALIALTPYRLYRTRRLERRSTK